MTHINADTHPGLHRYAQELCKYPELTGEQYTAIIADLKQPERNDVYQAAREKLICSHLRMVLTMAVNTIHRYYGLSMEDFVGIGNQAGRMFRALQSRHGRALCLVHEKGYRPV